MSAERIEHDALGDVAVPAAALYGSQTARALAVYPTTLSPLSEFPDFVRAYAQLKRAAAAVNRELGELDPERAGAIIAAADEVIAGEWAAEFPSPLLQGGGGVTTNMNVNEVLARRATQLIAARGGSTAVHPNDHVNRSQSTNDSYPTAAAIATIRAGERALRALEGLAAELLRVASEQGDLSRLGRTCLRDALPVTVRETHEAQAALIARAAVRISAALAPLAAVSLGATAVGTGAGAPPEFGARAIAELGRLSGLPLTQAPNLSDALANLDPLADVAHATEAAASAMARIARDLRLLSAGPNGGFNELELPKIAAGSSIMPGKSNPMIPEFVMQAHMLVQGDAATVRAAVDAGELELNVMEPVLYGSLWAACERVADAAELLREHCIAGLRWNAAQLAASLSGSFLERVERSRAAGYQLAAEDAAN